MKYETKKGNLSINKVILILVIIFIIVLLLIIILAIHNNNKNNNNTNNQNINNIDKNKSTIYENSSSPLVYFCPEDNCTEIFVETLSTADESIYCALYNLKKEELLNIFEEKLKEGIDVEIVVEESSYKNNTYVKYPNLNKKIITDKNFALMHNKFCIIDKKILLSGSANPSNDLEEDYNNIIIFNSPTLSKVYTDEYNEIHSGIFGEDGTKQSIKLVLNDITSANSNGINNIDGISNIDKENIYEIMPYFCPEECGDAMSNKIVNLIDSANESITIAAYSFTKDEIVTSLIAAKKRGIKINIIMENSQINVMGSQYERLVSEGFDVVVESTGVLMHHKVIIIDGRILITGSMNFTGNGMFKNDENALIIINPRIAKVYEDEMFRIIEILVEEKNR